MFRGGIPYSFHYLTVAQTDFLIFVYSNEYVSGTKRSTVNVIEKRAAGYLSVLLREDFQSFVIAMNLKKRND